MTTNSDGPNRDGRGKFARTVENAERDAEACRLKSRGRTYQQISDELGYGARQNAHRAVQQALAAIPALSAEESRRLQLDQLDYMTDRVLAVLERNHLTVTQGGTIVKDPVSGEPLIDDGPVLHAVDRLVRIQERMAKLRGLDAPTRHEVTLDYLDAQIAETAAEIAAELARRTEAGETDPVEEPEG